MKTKEEVMDEDKDEESSRKRIEEVILEEGNTGANAINFRLEYEERTYNGIGIDKDLFNEGTCDLESKEQD
ncbi:hypothetical protein Tco_0327256 [Tanacetum coccineum]